MFENIKKLRHNPLYLAMRVEHGEEYTTCHFVEDLVDASEYPTLDEPLQSIFGQPTSYAADLAEALNTLRSM